MEEQTVAHDTVKSPALDVLSKFDIESKFLGDLVRALFNQITVDNQKLDFTQLSVALGSLQVCMAGVLLDLSRAYARPVELQQGGDLVSRQLWERLQQLFLMFVNSD